MHDLPIPPARLLEESPNGWLLVDAEGKVRFSNSRASQLFGYSREELLGQRVEILVPDRLRETHTQHRDGYMTHPTNRPMGQGLELTARRKDGSEFQVEISLSPIQTREGTYVNAIVRDITERLQLEDERNRLSMELQMERERDRIGMDLHDGIMQQVYAAGLTLELALADVRKQPESAEAEIEQGIEQLHQVIGNIRSYIFDLRPRKFTGSLTSALTELAREFRQNTQIEVLEDIEGEEVDVDNEAATAAYHIVHEAFSNVRKHAGASHVALTVRPAGDHLLIEVRDDGRGFDPGAELPQVHRGLRNMDARARNAGLGLTVKSAPGEGTYIAVSVPPQG